MPQKEEVKTYKKPTVFDQLYPGRFIKAGELLGKKVTLTISSVDLEGLQGEDGKTKAKAIIAFKETDKGLVACKTNGLCLKAMFGPKLSEWVGKRITIFEDTWNGEPCTRVWGSPDLKSDMDVSIELPRRRPFKKTMHANGNPAAKPEPKPEPKPEEDTHVSPDMEGFGITEEETVPF